MERSKLVESLDAIAKVLADPEGERDMNRRACQAYLAVSALRDRIAQESTLERLLDEEDCGFTIGPGHPLARKLARAMGFATDANPPPP